MVALFSKETKKIEDASPAEQMLLMNLLAREYLGSKWKFFHKIKHANEGFNFMKQSTLMEQMKATRSALGFTSKSAKKAYRAAYQNSVKEIKKYTGKTDFQAIEEEVIYPKQYELFDSVIISWTPIKFLLPSTLIREKGKATQRHSEGLVGKLYYKVLSYYTIPQNWNAKTLTFYLEKISATSTYQDVVSELEPLKKDLDTLTENYQPFKFGEASLAKDAEQDENEFDDAMGGESLEEQVKTIYWYHCLYIAMEHFIFRYMLLLITSTSSTIAIRYIAKIFEPIISKTIEIKTLFLGSLETKPNLKKFRTPLEKLQIQLSNIPLKKTVKTKFGLFEIYPFNQNFLKEFAMDFSIKNSLDENSEWAEFIRFKVLGWEKSVEKDSIPEEESPTTTDEAPEEEVEKDPIELEVREYALMQIMSVMIQCINNRRDTRHKILERFKVHIKFEKERSLKNIERIRKNTEKKQRSMERKKAKFERMKQKETVQAVENDILKLQKRSGEMCNNLIKHTKIELHTQKQRLIKLFQEIAKEDTISPGEASKQILKLVEKLDVDGNFSKDFTRFVAGNIQDNYTRELEPFYENIFKILEPSTQEKLIFIQAIKKSGGNLAEQLKLTKEEQEKIDQTLIQLETKIKTMQPDIFECKAIFLSLVIPVQKLFEISIDNKSLQSLLSLKMTSPSKPKATPLKPDIIRALLLLNKIKHPVPSNNLLLSGQESEVDPTKAINKTILNKLIA